METVRDELLAEQKILNNTKNTLRDFNFEVSTKTQHLILAILSVVAVLIAWSYSEQSVVDSIQVIGFAAFVIGVVIEKFGSKISFSHSFLKIGKYFLFLLSVFIVFYSVISVSNLTQNTQAHSQPETQELYQVA